jgi:hypothetical protein
MLFLSTISLLLVSGLGLTAAHSDGYGYPTSSPPGNVQTCTTKAYTVTKDVTVPVVMVKTLTNTVTGKATKSIPYTAVSTINPGSIASSTKTLTRTSTVYKTTVRTSTVCQTNYFTSMSSSQTCIETPTVVVSYVPPNITTLYGSSALVYPTAWPSLSYSTCTVYSTSKTLIPTASVTCAGYRGW